MSGTTQSNPDFAALARGYGGLRSFTFWSGPIAWGRITLWRARKDAVGHPVNRARLAHRRHVQPRCGIEAIEAGQTRCTAADVAPDMNAAVVRKLRCENGLTFDLSQIVNAAGAKPLIAGAMKAILRPGDKAIGTAPVWTSYIGMMRARSGRPTCRLSAPSRSGGCCPVLGRSGAALADGGSHPLQALSLLSLVAPVRRRRG